MTGTSCRTQIAWESDGRHAARRRGGEASSDDVGRSTTLTHGPTDRRGSDRSTECSTAAADYIHPSTTETTDWRLSETESKLDESSNRRRLRYGPRIASTDSVLNVDIYHGSDDVRSVCRSITALQQPSFLPPWCSVDIHTVPLSTDRFSVLLYSSTLTPRICSRPIVDLWPENCHVHEHRMTLFLYKLLWLLLNLPTCQYSDQ